MGFANQVMHCVSHVSNILATLAWLFARLPAEMAHFWPSSYRVALCGQLHCLLSATRTYHGSQRAQPFPCAQADCCKKIAQRREGETSKPMQRKIADCTDRYLGSLKTQSSMKQGLQNRPCFISESEYVYSDLVFHSAQQGHTGFGLQCIKIHTGR